MNIFNIFLFHIYTSTRLLAFSLSPWIMDYSALDVRYPQVVDESQALAGGGPLALSTCNARHEHREIGSEFDADWLPGLSSHIIIEEAPVMLSIPDWTCSLHNDAFPHGSLARILTNTTSALDLAT